MQVAIYNNDIETVRNLAPEKWNDSSMEITPLLYASKYCRIECIDILAPYGNINVSDINSYTPLIYTVYHNETESTRLLLSLGADPNTQSGWIPLCMAIENQNLEIIKLLLEYQALTDGISSGNPLNLAINHRYEPIVELLLQYGAKLHDDHTLPTIILDNNINIIHLMIKYNYPFTYKLLYYALKYNKLEIAQLLLEAKTPLSDGILDNPFSIACKNNNIQMVKLLLQYPINCNLINNKGSTPFFYINSFKIMELVIDRCENINIKNNKGNTLIHKNQLPNIIQLLVDRGIDINAQNNKGFTALHKTYSNKDFIGAKFLLSLGSSPLIPDINGTTFKDMIFKDSPQINEDDLDDMWNEPTWSNGIEELKILITNFELLTIKEPADYS